MTLEQLPINGESLFDGRYRLIRSLGKGGMGEVYLAKDGLINGDYLAIKVLNENDSKIKSQIARFIQEVKLTRKVTSNYVVRTFDVAKSNNWHYITMEYVKGQTLSELIKSSAPLDYERCCRIIIQLTHGLSDIHKEGIVHRDLKPGNILITKADQIKIADFGIARQANSKLTGQDEIVGSSHYISPEVWVGKEISSATDIYALGIVMYEMLTGCLPFDATNPAELMWKHLQLAPTKPSHIVPELPRWIDEIVMAMLHKNEKERPCKAAEIACYLEKKLAQEEVRKLSELIVSQPQTEKVEEPPAIINPSLDLLSPVAGFSFNNEIENKSNQETPQIEKQLYRALRGTSQATEKTKISLISLYLVDLKESALLLIFAAVAIGAIWNLAPALSKTLAIAITKSAKNTELFTDIYQSLLMCFLYLIVTMPLLLVTYKAGEQNYSFIKKFIPITTYTLGTGALYFIYSNYQVNNIDSLYTFIEINISIIISAISFDLKPLLDNYPLLIKLNYFAIILIIQLSIWTMISVNNKQKVKFNYYFLILSLAIVMPCLGLLLSSGLELIAPIEYLHELNFGSFNLNLNYRIITAGIINWSLILLLIPFVRLKLN